MPPESGQNQFVTRLQAQYDKLLAVVLLVVLLACLVYLAMQVGAVKKAQAEFDGWMQSFDNDRISVDPVARGLYDVAVAALEEPYQVPYEGWTNNYLFVPESRLTCQSCNMPDRAEGTHCIHCGTERDPIIVQPVDTDSDGDGIYDVWEERYGLDPFDPADAALDMDGDGYTNLEEFTADTLPNVPTSHPVLINELRLTGIDSQSFGLRFESRVKSGVGYSFGLNYARRGKIETKFLKIGESIGGYTLTDYLFKEIEVGDPMPMKKDVSELTLTNEAGKQIVLKKGQKAVEISHTARFELARKEATFTAKEEGQITVDGNVYTVISIDTDKRIVVIKRDRDGVSYAITRDTAKILTSTASPGTNK